MSIIGLAVELIDFYEWLFNIKTPVAIGIVMSFLSLLLGGAVFIRAIQFQFRRRKLPFGIIIVEVVLGVAWGVLFFAFLGVLTYAAIG